MWIRHCLLFSCLLHLVVGHPEFERTPTDAEVALGGTAEFRCVASNLTFSANYVLWKRLQPTQKVLFIMSTKYDDEVPPSYNIFPSVDTETKRAEFTLKISNVRRNDSGTFECSIASSTLKAVALLTVTASPGDPIVKINKTSNLKEGEVVQVTCSTSGGHPAPDVTWYRNGVELTNVKHEESGLPYSEVRSVATIRLSRNDHRRALECRVKNKLNKDSPLSASLNLNVQYPPQVTVGPFNPFRVISGGSASLDCTVDANPPPNRLQWYRGTTSLASEGSASLVLSSLNEESSGAYRCQAENDIGRGSAEVTLDVLYAPRLTVPQTQTAKEGESVTLTCEVDSNPPPDVVNWWRKGADQPERSTSDGNGKVTLRLDSVRRQDGGELVCRAKSKLRPSEGGVTEEEREVAATLAVHYTPGPAHLSVAPAVLVGDTVTLKCDVSDLGQPRGHVEWTSSSGSLRAQGPELVIESVTLQHQGSYTCRGRNSIGYGPAATLDLEVLEPPTWLSPLKPEVQAPQAQQTALVLACSARARPAPQLVWMKAGVVLGAAHVDNYRLSYRTEKKNDGATVATVDLVFEGRSREKNIHLSADDRGEYTCIASSVSGAYPETQQSTRLLVQYPATITASKNRVASDFGTSVSLNCTAGGFPQPTLTWLNPDKTPLINGTGVYISEHEERDGSIRTQLVIRRFAQKDEGVYICRAKNHLGPSVEDTVHLTEISSPEAPSGPTIPDQSGVTWESVVLSWTAGFDGGRPQKFMIDVQKVGSSNRMAREASNWAIPVPASADTTYNISGLFPSTNYTFRVYARNEVGDSQSSQPLAIQTPELMLPQPSNVALTPSSGTLTFTAPEVEGLCARVERRVDYQWRVVQNCLLLQSSSVKVGEEGEFRVSLCLENRQDVCGPHASASRVKEDLATSMVILIVVVCVILVLVLATVLLVLFIKRRRQQKANKAAATTNIGSVPGKPTGRATPIHSVTEVVYNEDLKKPQELTGHPNEQDTWKAPVIPILTDDWQDRNSSHVESTSPYDWFKQSVDRTASFDTYDQQNYVNEHAGLSRATPQPEHNYGMLTLQSGPEVPPQSTHDPNSGVSLSSDESGYATESKPKKIFYEVVV